MFLWTGKQGFSQPKLLYSTDKIVKTIHDILKQPKAGNQGRYHSKVGSLQAIMRDTLNSCSAEEFTWVSQLFY